MQRFRVSYRYMNNYQTMSFEHQAFDLEEAERYAYTWASKTPGIKITKVEEVS